MFRWEPTEEWKKVYCIKGYNPWVYKFGGWFRKHFQCFWGCTPPHNHGAITNCTRCGKELFYW